MKIWLKRSRGLAVLLMFCVSLVCLWLYRDNPPEPDLCALCGSWRVFHAPALINLHTGEIAAEQPTGYFRLISAAGAKGYCEGGQFCHVTVPRNGQRMDAKLFCRNCRTLLSDAGNTGYALLDLYDPDDIRACEIGIGMEYTIRDYVIQIRENVDKTEVVIDVSGRLYN